MTVTIVITGTTGSGKTGIAERLAMDLESEIVSADSRCFYRGVLIGNGKYTMDLTIPYHLIDVTEPDITFTVRDFVDAAEMSLSSIHGRGQAAIVCGGSMLHIERLIEGMSRGPDPDPALRAWIDEYMDEFGLDDAGSMLMELDGSVAGTIDGRDRRRVRRGLETILASVPIRGSFGGIDGEVLGYFLDRDDVDLSSRVRSRAKDMFDEGWPEEVARLTKAYGQGIPALEMVGVPHVRELLAGRCADHEFIERVTRDTMRLARSQRKWARRLPFEKVDLSAIGPDDLAKRILDRVSQHVE